MVNKKLFKDTKSCVSFESSGVGNVGSDFNQIVLLKYHSYQKRLGRVGNKLSRTLTMVNAIGDIKSLRGWGNGLAIMGRKTSAAGEKRRSNKGQ